MNKIEALKNYLNEEVKEERGYFISESGNEYLVLTDEEAGEKAKEYILASLWAFNADFILSHCKNFKNMYPVEKKAALDALTEAQKNSCEALNGLVFALIENIDQFANDAVRIDGRGHFIALYDGEEIDLSNGLFAYRV